MDGQNTGTVTDRELVGAYAREGSEMAFRALVSRHVNLVYGAAVRQVGDPGVAEEVTQNVFVALARKAPRLAGHETLAGWLHRTAILEAKARIRADLRRRQREDTAAVLATVAVAVAVEREESSPMEDLKPLLDEALLALRDGDRVALVLRFLEERSLRDVGAVLGVDEDAARKRVSRALARVTEFFQARGFALPSAGGAAAMLGQSAGAAPAGLAGVASSAGLAAGAGMGMGATGVPWVLLKIMSLTKTQTAVVCAVLVAAPLASQERAIATARRERLSAEQVLSEERARLDQLMAEMARLEELSRKAVSDTLTARGRLAEREARRAAGKASVAPESPYLWNDASPLARVPKSMFSKRPPSGVRGKQGVLTEEIRSVLQLTDQEVAAVESALGRFLADYHQMGAGVVRAVEPTREELRGMEPGAMRAFEIKGIRDRVMERRELLFEELRSELDPERADILIRSLDDWVPVDDEVAGFHTGRAVWPNDHRVGFFRSPAQGTENPVLRMWLYEPGRGSWSSIIGVDDVPPHLRPHLADWIAEAREEHARAQQAAGAGIPGQVVEGGR